MSLAEKHSTNSKHSLACQTRWCYIPNMKALGIVVLDKKIFENCILKTYFLNPWPTYGTNWNNLNNFGRGPPRDHSCEVWSKSNERFQRRRCLSKTFTDDARRTTDKYKLKRCSNKECCKQCRYIMFKGTMTKWPVQKLAQGATQKLLQHQDRSQ